jgi:hypothetical protein
LIGHYAFIAVSEMIAETISNTFFELFGFLPGDESGSAKSRYSADWPGGLGMRRAGMPADKL